MSATLTEPEQEGAKRMIARQITPRGVTNPLVLRALSRVPRSRFIPAHLQGEAWEDRPLPIGQDQTISQPYIVALMTEYLVAQRGGKVLEIGTGCGYQTAILAELFDEVYSIEIHEELHETAREILESLGYDNVHLRVGDGYAGWPEAAPFDAIILTAAPGRIPQPLLDQLAEGGRLVGPEGEDTQELLVYERHNGKLTCERAGAVRFVPMTGRAGGTHGR